MNKKPSPSEKLSSWSIAKRRRFVANKAKLSPQERLEYNRGGIISKNAEHWVENAIGIYSLPLGIADRFVINGKKYLVPLCTEEPSVIAAACYGAKIASLSGGFWAQMESNLTTAEVLLTNIPDIALALKSIEEKKDLILQQLAIEYPRLYAASGGCKSIDMRPLPHLKESGQALAVLLFIDCLEAQGANLASQLAEKIAPTLQKLTKARRSFSIVSNLSTQKTVEAFCLLPIKKLATKGLDGGFVAEGMIELSRLAEVDPYRACTHNKGILNGTEAVIVATGNDPRANTAGAHAYAAMEGSYKPLSRISMSDTEYLKAEIKIPLSVGTKGGTIRNHKLAVLNQKLLDITSAKELAMVAACVGLATNIASLRAIASEGISHHHLALHNRFSAKKALVK